LETEVDVEYALLIRLDVRLADGTAPKELEGIEVVLECSPPVPDWERQLESAVRVK
jgi:hypothetical protein